MSCPRCGYFGGANYEICPLCGARMVEFDPAKSFIVKKDWRVFNSEMERIVIRQTVLSAFY